MNYCSVCGEEINEQDKSCSGCGAENQFYKKDSVTNNNSESAEKEVVKAQVDSKPSVKTTKKNSQEPPKKSVSNVKIFYLVIVLILVGSLLLISSGSFESPSINPAVENQSANPHQGIDLSSLEQIKELESKIEANGNDTNSLLQLAHLLNDSGFKEKAIDRYKQYLKMNPTEPDVLVDMGVCYYELGRNDEAMTAMENAIKIKPDHQIAHLNLGIVNSSAGNIDKAKSYWKKAVAIDPNSEVGKRAEELIKQH